MSDEPFFSVGTVGLSKRQGRKPSSLLQAINHNQRATQKERGARAHIEPARMCLNEVLAGPDTPEAVVALAQSLMLAAGVDTTKLRKDYTQAIELLFSLSANHRLDDRAYFTACTAWSAAQFGEVNILSAVIHNDEAKPHMHVLISPLVDGRVRGRALLTRPKLAVLRESFFKVVAGKFGMRKPLPKLSGARRGELARMVLERLESTQDTVLRSAAWSSIRKAIEREPGPMAADLGIEFEVAAPTRKTMEQIFTSTGKGPKVERADKKAILKPIGFATEPGSAPEKHRNLSCVGIEPNQHVPAKPKAPRPPPARPPPLLPARPPEPAHADQTQASQDKHQAQTDTAPAPSFTESVRVRDSEIDTALYDPMTGEYFQPPTRLARCGRAAADEWVSTSLASQRAKRLQDHQRIPP